MAVGGRDLEPVDIPHPSDDERWSIWCKREVDICSMPSSCLTLEFWRTMISYQTHQCKCTVTSLNVSNIL